MPQKTLKIFFSVLLVMLFIGFQKDGNVMNMSWLEWPFMVFANLVIIWREYTTFRQRQLIGVFMLAAILFFSWLRIQEELHFAYWNEFGGLLAHSVLLGIIFSLLELVLRKLAKWSRWLFRRLKG